ncbi:MobA/MobL family protein, partial [Streptococcus pneumoniae]|uniref:MobA/MobL family protein n=1 Tax=Streptococcus pneumoniae TaxID=1313 RepID=UPI001885A6B9
MADSFHFSVNIISRGKGKSAVASAAYISGEKIKNEWDGVTHDYTRKEKILVKNIILPDHIPKEFNDRSTDYAIHDESQDKNGNIHCHIMTIMRPINEK